MTPSEQILIQTLEDLHHSLAEWGSLDRYRLNARIEQGLRDARAALATDAGLAPAAAPLVTGGGHK